LSWLRLQQIIPDVSAGNVHIGADLFEQPGAFQEIVANGIVDVADLAQGAEAFDLSERHHHQEPDEAGDHRAIINGEPPACTHTGIYFHFTAPITARGTKVDMSFVKVGSLSALPAGSVMEAESGGSTYAICNFNGELRAYAGECPHAGGPLGQGTIEGNRLVCPWHAWEYDCLTGVNDYDESVKLDSFPVKVDGDDILIDVP